MRTRTTITCLALAVLAAGGITPVATAQPAPTAAPGALKTRPFTIAVPDEVLADLKRRLTQARFPDQIENAGWDYGTELAYLKSLAAYWRDRFDWRARERGLNQFSQFVAAVDGLDLHFIHQRSPHAGAMPLMITHGWPGSVVEFERIIGPLTDPTRHGGRAEDAFHVVAASLPGFGYSGKPRQPGYNPRKIGELLAALMEGLGYDRYGLQGGDWGAIVSTHIARDRPAHIVGLHSNFCIGATAPAGVDPAASAPAAEIERWRERQRFYADEQGYSQIQGSRPQTIGYALNDSPVGLAAWIVEKFRSWSDVSGDVERKFTKDDLLTNITWYWVTETPTSAARIYFENRKAATTAPAGRVDVPTACAVFPREILYSPRAWLEQRYNIRRYTEMPRGGHFAAMEEPALLVDDIRAFFRDLRR